MCSKWNLASIDVPRTLVTGTCGPISQSAPNGTSGPNNNYMNPKLGKYNLTDQFGQGRIINANKTIQ